MKVKLVKVLKEEEAVGEIEKFPTETKFVSGHDMCQKCPQATHNPIINDMEDENIEISGSNL
jgi:hypothetical protein